ncbi:MAG: DUF721 domain-containing protein [Alphaproteobacteria bacterium]|nr:DUF721 domain-containing protein [Alphaproteobacteria bacterium]
MAMKRSDLVRLAARPLETSGRSVKSRGVRQAAPAAGGFANMIIARLAQKTRFVDPGLLARWPTLVGKDVAGVCRPGRLLGSGVGRTMEIHVADGAAAALAQFRHDDIVDRLNAYFGQGVVARLSVRQVGGSAPGTSPTGTPPQASAPRGLSRFRDGD